MSTREQRRAMLQDELSQTETDLGPTTPTPGTPRPDGSLIAPEAPPAAALFDANAFQAAIVSAITAAVQGMTGAMGVNNTQLAQTLAEALKTARQPIPEIPFADYHGKSHVHPGGKDEPREALRAPHFLGVWNTDTGRAIAAIPIDDRLMRDDEIAALNRVRPVLTQIERSDGSPIEARVVEQLDAAGALHRVIIAFPPSAFSKEHRNTLPSMKRLATELTAAAAPPA